MGVSSDKCTVPAAAAAAAWMRSFNTHSSGSDQERCPLAAG
jgi:hypothetical protein